MEAQSLMFDSIWYTEKSETNKTNNKKNYTSISGKQIAILHSISRYSCSDSLRDITANILDTRHALYSFAYCLCCVWPSARFCITILAACSPDNTV